MFPLGIWEEEKLVSLQIEIELLSTELKLNSGGPESCSWGLWFWNRSFHNLQQFFLFLYVGDAQKQQKQGSTL